MVRSNNYVRTMDKGPLNALLNMLSTDLNIKSTLQQYTAGLRKEYCNHSIIQTPMPRLIITVAQC